MTDKYKDLREALEKATRVVMFTNADDRYEHGVDPSYIEEFKSVAKPQAIAALLAERDALREALRDMTSGWRYIRETHGDLYGVGWDRAEEKARAALGEKP